MFANIMRSSSVERLKGILASRYGMGFELSFLNDSNVVELAGGASSLREGALFIPIFSNGNFLAMAKVPGAESLSETSHDAITEIVRMILEPALYNMLLEQTERTITQPMPEMEELQVVSDDSRSQVILMTSTNPHRIPRLAAQVHDILNTWALVRWSEMRQQIKTSQDIRSLGRMCLFVEDIYLLTEEEKVLLEEWIATSQATSEPILLLGSSSGWQQISEAGLLPKHLLSQAGLYQIEADRLPSERRTCEEAIKLLLDKEASLNNH